MAPRRMRSAKPRSSGLRRTGFQLQWPSSLLPRRHGSFVNLLFIPAPVRSAAKRTSFRSHRIHYRKSYHVLPTGLIAMLVEGTAAITSLSLGQRPQTTVGVTTSLVQSWYHAGTAFIGRGGSATQSPFPEAGTTVGNISGGIHRISSIYHDSYGV